MPDDSVAHVSPPAAVTTQERDARVRVLEKATMQEAPANMRIDARLGWGDYVSRLVNYDPSRNRWVQWWAISAHAIGDRGSN